MLFSFMNLMEFDHLQCSYLKCILQSLLLTVIYVSILNVWKPKCVSCFNFLMFSKHPSAIKKRFVSILFMLIFSLFYTWNEMHVKTKVPIWYWLGLKWDRIMESIISSLILTFIIFLGPICLFCLEVEEIHLKSIISAKNIKSKLTNTIWLNKYVVTPVSEEFIFRACIIPLLLKCFQPVPTIFINAVFFGTAHFICWIRGILTYKLCDGDIFETVFQFVYYTVFGAYSALLFIHTGNIIGPIVAHTFCNYMGLPEFQVLFQLPEPRRSGLFVMSFMGLILWLVVIKFVSHPWIYSNQMDWTEMNQCYTTAN